MYPDLPKIELFARRRRPGWQAWGNELPPEEDAAEPNHERMLEGLKATANSEQHLARRRERKERERA
jgi:hypothetical protein